MGNRSQQQKNNVKQRKAKQRAVAKKEHRSWIDRVESTHGKPWAHHGSGLGKVLSRPVKSSAEQREAQERLLCGLYGEKYRP